MTKHAVDVALLALYGRKGRGKTTLAVSLAIQYALNNNRPPIYSNVHLTIPGLNTIHVSKVSELIQECNNDPCTCAPRVVIVDEFDKSFTSRINWVEKSKEQALTALVSNIRKHRVIAFIATAQLRKKIKNDFRHNCDYVIEPTGSLDSVGRPEYYLWDDVELYEESSRTRYQAAVLCASILPLEFLQTCFNTREVIPLEWE